jgi:hypothetical protein
MIKAKRYELHRLLLLLTLFLQSTCLAQKPASVSYYQHIRPIIDARCMHCHSGAGVSFPFGDLEQSYSFKTAIADAVLKHRMPPWMAAPGFQKYQHDLSLSSKELGLFQSWKDNEFSKGVLNAYKPRKGMTAAFKRDTSIKVTSSIGFVPEQSMRDDYRCFLTDWPVKTPMYVTGIHVKPGNLRISHHAILYVVSGKHRAALEHLDQEEPGAGYRCFGGPLPDRLGDARTAENLERKFPGTKTDIQQQSFWLSHWAPGMDGYSLPPQTGILVQPNSTIIIQMHYYTGFAAKQSDRGIEIDFTLAAKVTKPAFNWPLTDYRWLNATQNNTLVVPARGNASVSTNASLEGLDKYLSTVSGMPIGEIKGLEVHSANLHMHLIGASGQVQLLGKNSREILLKVPTYLFGWQRDFVFQAPKRIDTRDLKNFRIQVDCTFANTTAKPVYGGYGSDQEMCYNFSLISIAR